MALNPKITVREFDKFREASGRPAVAVVNPDGSAIGSAGASIQTTGSTTITTPNGDSAMDETNDAVKVTLATKLDGIITGAENDNVLVLPGRRIDAYESGVETADATTAVAVKVAVSAKSIYITDVSISTDTAGWIKLQDDAATTIMQKKYFPANSIWSKSYQTPHKVTVSQGVKVISQNTGNITVGILGYAI